MAKSSIHIQRAVDGSVGHNSREHFSYSVVFTDEENECTHSVDEAYSIYRDELAIRTQAYTERTGQKLQKSAVTQLSSIINLEKHHTLKDLEPIKEHLEKTFGTKVYQMAIHRDEGKLVSNIDGTELYSGKDFFLNPEDKKFYSDKQFIEEIDMQNYEIVKNYHAHIEMMGLDTDGNAIRQKMNKRVLKEMQTFVAKELKMERGKENISYSQEEMKQILAITGNKSDYESSTLFAKKFNEVAKELGIYKEKTKRRDTHIFKDVGAEREGAKREALKENNALKEQIKELKNENTSLKKSNSTLKGSNTKLKNENSKLKELNKKLEEDIKKLNLELKTKMRENGAVRADYAKLEQLNKELKEEIKNKTLNYEKLESSFKDLEKTLISKDEKINDLEVENKDLKTEIEALKYQLDLKEKRSQAYFGLNQELKSEIIALKSQINALEGQKEDLEEKVIDLEEKIVSRANTDDLTTKQIKKEDYLSQIVNQYDSSRTGTDKSEALNLQKTEVKEVDLSRFKASQNRSFLDKLNAIDEKIINDNTDNTKTNTIIRRGRDR